MERRLAAILAADVAGYSRLMGEDEVGTLSALRQLRTEILIPKVDTHSGRIVKSMGDGWLVEFTSVIDAVNCAIEVQECLAVLENIKLRVGMHLGDITHEEEDIFGDGVNIASRLQEIAEPGGIVISDMARRSIDRKRAAAFVDLGVQNLKNISEPIAAYGWGMKAISADATALPLPDKPSIAVLPFDNMSGDPEQEYFADGIVEEITAALSRVRSFFVIARNSAFAYRKKSTDIREIAKELNVRYLLQGGVRRASNRLRITAQLVRGVDGGHIWADRYEGTLDDIFELQDSIASAIAGVLQPTIREEEIHLSRRKPPSNLQAYDYVMQAFSHAWMLDRKGNRAAMASLEKAMAADPDYALAFALASWCEGQKSVYQWTEDLDVAKQRALLLAQRAFSLDPNDPTVLTALGTAQTVANELESASENIRRALEIDPNSAWAWSRMGWVCHYSSDYAAAVSAFENALRLSPLDPMNFNCFIGLGAVCTAREEYRDAIKYVERGLRENPDATWAYRYLTVCYGHEGRKEEAKRCVGILQREYPDLNVESIMQAIPLRDPSFINRYRQGLILAGVPKL